MNPDRWLVLTARLPAEPLAPEVARDELAETLLALGGAAVQEEEDGGLTTFILPPDDVEAFLSDAADRIEEATGLPAELDWRWQENEDWARLWKEGIQPRRVGERLIISPTWAEPETRPDDVVIFIDPEMAFGTGEHATTRGALRLIEHTIEPGDRVLDVGAGSGILGIAATLLGAASVVGVEMDEDSLINARENIERNGVKDRVILVHGLVDDAYLDRRAPEVDLIVANVLSGVLVPLLPGFHRRLRADASEGRNGRLILGGILEVEAPMVREAAERAGFRTLVEDVEEGWWSALFEAAQPSG